MEDATEKMSDHKIDMSRVRNVTGDKKIEESFRRKRRKMQSQDYQS
jgi:hypothetical protein